MQKRKHAYITAASEHCFDLTGLISVVGVTDIYSKQMPEKDFLLVVYNYISSKNPQKPSLPNPLAVKSGEYGRYYVCVCSTENNQRQC